MSKTFENKMTKTNEMVPQLFVHIWHVPCLCFNYLNCTGPGAIASNKMQKYGKKHFLLVFCDSVVSGSVKPQLCILAAYPIRARISVCSNDNSFYVSWTFHPCLKLVTPDWKLATPLGILGDTMSTHYPLSIAFTNHFFAWLLGAKWFIGSFVEFATAASLKLQTFRGTGVPVQVCSTLRLGK